MAGLSGFLEEQRLLKPAEVIVKCYKKGVLAERGGIDERINGGKAVLQRIVACERGNFFVDSDEDAAFFDEFYETFDLLVVCLFLEKFVFDFKDADN